MSKNHIIFAWTLVFVLLFSSMRSGFMLGFYMIDSSSFIELFFVNQEQPELECNGKCELSKLAHQDDANPDRSSYLDILHRELLYYNGDFCFNLYFLPLKIKPQFVYKNNYLFIFSPTIDHPPALV